MLEPGRQAKAAQSLAAIGVRPGLSRDVSDIVGRMQNLGKSLT
jgi:hypothetical protein